MTDLVRLERGGEIIDVPQVGLLIGSGTGCDLVLSGAGITTTHAQITRADGVLHLLALAPDHRLTVNGERVTDSAASLRAGDVFEIAGHAFAVTAAEGTTSAHRHVLRQRLSIGRGPDNEIVLGHPAVSVHHAEVIRDDGGVRVRDLSSATGTRVNSAVVSNAELRAGDEIGIGPFRLVWDGTALVELDTAESTVLSAFDVEVSTATGHRLLEPTSLQLRPGEMISIIGPSGAGKSTLLKVLAGVDLPNRGEVLMGGDPVRSRLTEIGYVPQSNTVHDLLSAREGLRYAAALRLPEDTPDAELDAAVERVLSEVELTERADVRVGSLSGGQRKRVAVALELISRPSVMFLDEPTTGLDPGLERRMMRLARGLADGGQTVVVVTHATQSLDLCDRVAIMAPGGRLLYFDDPAGAPAHFGVEDIDDVYDLLEDGSEQWPTYEEHVARPPRRQTGRVRIPRQLLPQVTTLTRRYAVLLARDRRNLRIMLGQVIGLAIATAFLFASDVFGRSNGITAHAGSSAQLLFLMVTIAIWFGAISSARQIIGERAVLDRELATGVRISSYLLSKALVLGVLTAVQTVVFAEIVLLLRPLHAGAGGLLIILVLTAWVGAAMGLLISALARSEDQATSLIPIALIPQLLFGGAIVSIHQLGWLMKFASVFFFARWSFAGSGSAIELQQRIAEDPSFSQVSRYGNSFFGLGQGAAVFILLLFLAGFSGLVYWALRGEPSPREVYQRVVVRVRMELNRPRPT